MTCTEVDQKSHKPLDKVVIPVCPFNEVVDVSVLVKMSSGCQEHHSLFLVLSACESLCYSVSRVLLSSPEQRSKDEGSYDGYKTDEFSPELIEHIDVMEIYVTEFMRHNESDSINVFIFHVSEI